MQNPQVAGNDGIPRRHLLRRAGFFGAAAVGIAALYPDDALAELLKGFEKKLREVAGESGNYNVSIGSEAGNAGEGNVAIGSNAGKAATGSRNVLIGYQAGEAAGTNSDRLYIANSNTNTPLIGGDFASEEVTVHGSLAVTGSVSGTNISATLIDISKPPYNVLPGVTPSPELGIQEAINKAAENAESQDGPTEVYIPAGTYSGMTLHTIPGQSSVAASIYGQTGVKLRFATGAVFKWAAKITLPENEKHELATQAHFISTRHPFGGGTTEGWIVEGAILDCNGPEQSKPEFAQNGFFFGQAKECQRIRCRVRNLWGNAGGTNSSKGEWENFHFEDHDCLNCSSHFCVAEGEEAGVVGKAETATGFSSDNSVGSVWTNCVARGMRHGQGFTAWQSADLTYTGCWSYLNSNGFNCERSMNVVYAGCTAGGKSAFIANGDAANPFFPGTGNEPGVGWVSLGNTGAGWKVEGCAHVEIGADCISSYNTSLGAYVGADPVNVAGKHELKGCSVKSGSKEVTIPATEGMIPGMSVVGSNIPLGSVIEVVSSTTALQLNKAATGTSTEEQLTFDEYRCNWDIRVNGTHQRNGTNVEIRDYELVEQQSAKVTEGSTTITGLTEATKRLTVGWSVTGSSIYPGATITSIKSETEISISAPAKASSTGALSFGPPRQQIESVSFANAIGPSGVGEATLFDGWAPWYEVISRNAASGWRIGVKTGFASLGSRLMGVINIEAPNGTSANGLNASNEPLRINTQNQVGTLGRFRRARKLEDEGTAVAIADDVLWWKTLTATREAELPKIAEVPEGTEYEVVDGSGKASTSVKITFKAHSGSSDKVEGRTSVEEANGSRTARNLGGAWICS
jgi:hypothetical protein